MTILNCSCSSGSISSGVISSNDFQYSSHISFLACDIIELAISFSLCVIGCGCFMLSNACNFCVIASSDNFCVLVIISSIEAHQRSLLSINSVAGTQLDFSTSFLLVSVIFSLLHINFLAKKLLLMFTHSGVNDLVLSNTALS